ncbi:hypothetical protein GCM10011297_23340 [Bacterioplanes sanyensis]|uniref:hypothetical protein n=1 Tax=Bacterioplanes sanyensis TaxID=1249553 RepID=UPI00167A0560|nr:hypothetical protein [Bacterioplanes sanyensis]GGY49699.1 hypothetical protein GCM10011297_23340 [Bacterioplanes sanyensis]
MESADVSAPTPIAHDSLHRLTDVLIRRGDLASLEPAAVAVLLAVRYAVQQQPDQDYCPQPETLSELTGMDEALIRQGLEGLYRHGYLNSESYWRDGESHTRYRVRERQLLIDEQGEVNGELSWDLNNPSQLFGLHEFRNLLASGSLGNAKVVHIERLQLNISSTRDDGVSVFSQPSAEDEQNVVQPLNSATQRILEDFQQAQQSLGQTAEVVATESLAMPESDEASVSAHKRHAEADTDSDELGNEFKGIYQQYVARLHQEFSHALQAAEQALQDAYHLKIEHQQSQPRQPIGLGLLLHGGRWSRELQQWQQEQLQLDNNYDTSLAEKQRLMAALIPGTQGELPLYIQEALEQIQQDHPHLRQLAQQKLHMTL